MKEKIISALKTEYSNLGLSQKALDGVASMLIAQKTIESEDKISEVIKGDGIKGLLTMFQSETDALRTARTKAEKDLEDYKKLHPSTDPAHKDEPDPVAEKLAELEKKQKELDDTIKAANEKARQTAVIESLHKLLKEKGCDNDFIRNTTLKGIAIGENDTAESLVETYKTAYDKNFKDAYGDGPVPPRGGNKPSEYQQGDFKSEAERLRAEGKLPAANN